MSLINEIRSNDSCINWSTSRFHFVPVILVRRRLISKNIWKIFRFTLTKNEKSRFLIIWTINRKKFTAVY